MAAVSNTFIPKSFIAIRKTEDKLRTAHTGVGGMDEADLKSIPSHLDVVVVGLCDVDSNAKTYKGYRVMLKEIAS